MNLRNNIVSILLVLSCIINIGQPCAYACGVSDKTDNKPLIEICEGSKCKESIDSSIVEFSQKTAETTYDNTKSYKETFVPDNEISIVSNVLLNNLWPSDLEKLEFDTPKEESSKSNLEYELFPEGSPKIEDIKQGSAETCYFVAAVISVLEVSPEVIKNAITDNNDGTVTVHLYDPRSGELKHTKIQKTVPVLPSRYMFFGKKCLWAELLLKGAVASDMFFVNSNPVRCIFGHFSDPEHMYQTLSKKHTYLNMEKGLPELAIEMLTGKECFTESFSVKSSRSKDELYNLLKSTLNEKNCVVCNFCNDFSGTFLSELFKYIPFFPRISKRYQNNNGLITNHAFSVISVYEDDNKQRWVKFVNPWKSSDITYSNIGKLIENVDDINNQGVSTVKFEDFANRLCTVTLGQNKKLKPSSLGQILQKRFKADFLKITIPTTLACMLYYYCLIPIKNSVYRYGYNKFQEFLKEGQDPSNEFQQFPKEWLAPIEKEPEQPEQQGRNRSSSCPPRIMVPASPQVDRNADDPEVSGDKS